jgi:hypothetical protein
MTQRPFDPSQNPFDFSPPLFSCRLFNIVFLRHAQFSEHTHDVIYTPVIFVCKSAIFTRRVISTSVISTRTSVNYTRRIRFPHAECAFYTQSVTSTHMRMILTRMSLTMIVMSVIMTRSILIFTHTQVVF